MSLHQPKVRRAAIAFILVTAVLDIVAMGSSFRSCRT